MKMKDILTLLDARLLRGLPEVESEFSSAFSSDMMSDVLAFVKDQGVLLTGLVNAQVIRTAAMMDMPCIVFVRSKIPTEEMLILAEECGIVVMRSSRRAYEACGILYSHGLNSLTGQ